MRRTVSLFSMIVDKEKSMLKKSKVSYSVFLKAKQKISRTPKPQLYSPREKMQNCIWLFTLGDADDHPSIPHAHAQEVGYRLDAWTGEIYPAGNERVKRIGKLKEKELQKLHKDPGFLKFAKKQIDWYREEHPHIRFSVPDWFELKYMRTCVKRKGKPEEINNYIFIGKAVITKTQ